MIFDENYGIERTSYKKLNNILVADSDIYPFKFHLLSLTAKLPSPKDKSLRRHTRYPFLSFPHPPPPSFKTARMNIHVLLNGLKWEK